MQSFEEILHAMKSCEQMPGLSVLAHGEMVNDYFLDLIKGTGKFSWKLPDWCTQEFLEKIGDIHLTSSPPTWFTMTQGNHFVERLTLREDNTSQITLRSVTRS